MEYQKFISNFLAENGGFASLQKALYNEHFIEVIEVLEKSGEIRYTDIWKSTGISGSQLNNTLKIMKELDLINKKVMNDGYRSVLYNLTGYGKTVFTALSSYLHNVVNREQLKEQQL